MHILNLVPPYTQRSACISGIRGYTGIVINKIEIDVVDKIEIVVGDKSHKTEIDVGAGGGGYRRIFRNERAAHAQGRAGAVPF